MTMPIIKGWSVLSCFLPNQINAIVESGNLQYRLVCVRVQSDLESGEGLPLTSPLAECKAFMLLTRSKPRY